MSVETMETIASAITVIFILIGLPTQIVRNYRAKSVRGLSLLFFILSFLVWCSWSYFGYLANSPFMAVSQAIGGLTSLIVLIQFIIYRKK